MLGHACGGCHCVLQLAVGSQVLIGAASTVAVCLLHPKAPQCPGDAVVHQALGKAHLTRFPGVPRGEGQVCLEVLVFTLYAMAQERVVSWATTCATCIMLIGGYLPDATCATSIMQSSWMYIAS